METLFIYFGKIILTSGVMFLYYQLFLKDKTFHHYNRFYLMSVMLVSLLLPMLKVSYFTIEVSNDVYLLINKFQNFNTKTNEHDFSYLNLCIIAIGVASVFLLGRLFYGIFKISRFKNQFPKEEFKGINFYQTNLNNAPFSYFKNLFWKNSILIHSDLGKQILKHEMVHIEQKHSFDKIFMEIITAIFWFNPIFYIIKKEIHLIHEYLADKKSVKNSDTKAFAQMLLASHFSGKVIPATSPFLSSNLKKRLKMLQKPTTKFSYARRIFALPLMFIVAFAYLINAKNKEIKATNIEIEKAVAQIKKDTVKADLKQPSDSVLDKKNSEKLKIDEDFVKNNQEIATIGKTIQEKSKELKRLKPETKEFTDKVQEINSLSDKINTITNSESYKNTMEKLNDLNVYYYNTGDEKFTIKINSDDFKNINKTKKYFNSDEWKKNVKELENLKVELPEMPDLPPIPDVAYSFDGTDIFKEHPELFSSYKKTGKLSDEDKKKLEKIAKEQAKLAKKQAELAKKQAEIARKNSDKAYKISTIAFNNSNFTKTYSGDKKVIVIDRNSPESLTFTDDSDITSGKMKIYIDGKLSTKEEMDKLSSDKISSVNINKQKNDGNLTGEIKIVTKK